MMCFCNDGQNHNTALKSEEVTDGKLKRSDKVVFFRKLMVLLKQGESTLISSVLETNIKAVLGTITLLSNLKTRFAQAGRLCFDFFCFRNKY
ncbi:hypothetical protein V6N13_015004 [Hibiscus sabdariffa]|uniref:Uncharacterized protein n=1 Tax=Hibiscus sabdariffa TaxID=183260 RepID=A0ABR2RX28_9ROSI